MSFDLTILKREEINELKSLFENTPEVAEFNPFKIGSKIIFDWLFFSDNYIPSIYIVASDIEKKEILGTLSSIFITMQSPSGDKFLTIKPENTLVSIKGIIRYKSKDILKEMFDRIAQETKFMDIQFLWGFTNAVHSFERVGFIHSFSSQQGIYTIKPLCSYRYLSKLNASNKTKQKVQILGLSLISYFRAILYPNNYKGFDIKEIEINEVDEKLLLSFLPENLYCIYLDKYFLNWRIKNNVSELKFTILQFRNQSKKIISYLIYSNNNNSIYFIEQLLFDRTLNKKEKTKVLSGTLQYFKNKNAVIVRAMGFNHNFTNKEEIELLKSVGFIFIKKGIPFIFKSNEKNIKQENIYLSHLNTLDISF